MKKRLIDCTARELAAYTKEDLLRAIAERLILIGKRSRGQV